MFYVIFNLLWCEIQTLIKLFHSKLDDKNNNKFHMDDGSTVYTCIYICIYMYCTYYIQYQGYAILIYTLHCQLIEQFTEHGKMFYLKLLYNVRCKQLHNYYICNLFYSTKQHIYIYI